MSRKHKNMPKKKFGVRFYTRRSTEQIEDWIKGHCAGNWSIQLADFGIGAGSRGKRLIVYFENPLDRRAFQDFIRNGQFSLRMFTKTSWDQVEAWLNKLSLKYQDIHLGGIVREKNGWGGKNVTVYFDNLRDKKAFQSQKPKILRIVRFFTRRPVDDFEDWIENNCMRDYDIRLAGVTEDTDGNIVKKLIIRFESHRDGLLFEQHFLTSVSRQGLRKSHLSPLVRLLHLFN
ncbi:MAG: hypothetical protein V3U48_02485 [Rhodospirillales bacterium]